ncbi:MAG: hypothetical protein AUH86_14470 [Acidobacteria bacterium 13_1_40CM_4_58_4]|nr:MAG: hypothetical protein AUH86_14470 [Acidobacteria bacterium 13_1_40CM_4_58_4]
MIGTKPITSNAHIPAEQSARIFCRAIGLSFDKIAGVAVPAAGIKSPEGPLASGSARPHFRAKNCMLETAETLIHSTVHGPLKFFGHTYKSNMSSRKD